MKIQILLFPCFTIHALSQKIDMEVKKITDEAYQKALFVLETNKEGLHKLAAELLDKETLTGDQVRDILEAAKTKGAAS